MVRTTESYINTIIRTDNRVLYVLDAMRASGADYLYCADIAQAEETVVLVRTPQGVWRDDVEPELAEAIMEYGDAHMKKSSEQAALAQFEERMEPQNEQYTEQVRELLHKLYAKLA